ncbi:MAG TPA: carbamoyl-phosphate synthase small subunit, partial [Nannocystis exedens]|nr:carbamoyl-phosphate synthase small subunit [Nannocystis exedens]
GLGFGAATTVVGEVVFNTALTGYQEILSDPSYCGQLVCLTAVEIGNVGVNDDDEESLSTGAGGLLCRGLSPFVANFRGQRSLPEYLVDRGIPGLAEFDTRALTRRLREGGSIMAALSSEGDDVDRLLALARAARPVEGRDLASEVCAREPYTWSDPSYCPPDLQRPRIEADLHVVVVDFGVKHNILRRLCDEGARVTVVPAGTNAAAILELRPDGVLLSNGPGDPAALEQPVVELCRLIELAPTLPIFGICLGHQVLALALGGQTYKLKFGHHGANHPIARDGRVLITSQNHGFAVDLESLGQRAELTDQNLFDRTVAGIRLVKGPISSVQYHPEASPGPHDGASLLREFVQQIRATL